MKAESPFIRPFVELENVTLEDCSIINVQFLMLNWIRFDCRVPDLKLLQKAIHTNLRHFCLLPGD